MSRCARNGLRGATECHKCVEKIVSKISPRRPGVSDRECMVQTGATSVLKAAQMSAQIVSRDVKKAPRGRQAGADGCQNRARACVFDANKVLTGCHMDSKLCPTPVKHLFSLCQKTIQNVIKSCPGVSEWSCRAQTGATTVSKAVQKFAKRMSRGAKKVTRRSQEGADGCRNRAQAYIKRANKVSRMCRMGSNMRPTHAKRVKVLSKTIQTIYKIKV